MLNYTRIKPRLRPPQKKSAYITHTDFSAAKIEKKCANYASKYGIYIYTYTHIICRNVLRLSCIPTTETYVGPFV